MSEQSLQITFEKMIDSIDEPTRHLITKKIFELKGPVEAVATLSAAIAYIVIMTVDKESSAIHNIDEIADLAKKLAGMLLRSKSDSGQESTGEETKH